MAQNNEQDEKILFGKRLKETRTSFPEYKDIKIFAKIIGTNKENLYKYEQGKSTPSLYVLIKICKALDKTPSYMLAPLLDLSFRDKDFLEIVSKMKDFYNDVDAWKLIRTLFLGLDIYNFEKKRNAEEDIINILEGIKVRLIKKKL